MHTALRCGLVVVEARFYKPPSLPALFRSAASRYTNQLFQGAYLKPHCLLASMLVSNEVQQEARTQ